MAISREKKRVILEELEDKFKRKKISVFCDYRGLKVKDLNSLRRSLKEENIDLGVYKKTLIRLALEKLNINLDIKTLKGQTAIAFAYDDEIDAPKSIYQFSRANKSLKVRAGILGEETISREEVLSIAKLSSKDDLLAQFVYISASPINGFVNVLRGNLNNLVFVLSKIKK